MTSHQLLTSYTTYYISILYQNYILAESFSPMSLDDVVCWSIVDQQVQLHELDSPGRVAILSGKHSSAETSIT